MIIVMSTTGPRGFFGLKTCNTGTMRWTAYTSRNRVRVTALLWLGSIIAIVWSSFTTQASVAGMVLTLMTWIASAFGMVTGWWWLRAGPDRWLAPFAAGSLVVVGAIIWALVSGTAPVIAVLVPFFAMAAWLAPALDRSRQQQWRDEQRQRESRVFSPDDATTDPMLAKRELRRKEDSVEQYPATLRS